MKIRVIGVECIRNAIAEPHPTIPRCMVLTAWKDIHAPSRCLPVKGADGTEAYRAEFSENDETARPTTVAKVVAEWDRIISPDGLRKGGDDHQHESRQHA